MSVPPGTPASAEYAHKLQNFMNSELAFLNNGNHMEFVHWTRNEPAAQYLSSCSERVSHADAETKRNYDFGGKDPMALLQGSSLDQVDTDVARWTLMSSDEGTLTTKIKEAKQQQDTKTIEHFTKMKDMVERHRAAGTTTSSITPLHNNIRRGVPTYVGPEVALITHRDYLVVDVELSGDALPAGMGNYPYNPMVGIRLPVRIAMLMKGSSRVLPRNRRHSSSLYGISVTDTVPMSVTIRERHAISAMQQPLVYFNHLEASQRRLLVENREAKERQQLVQSFRIRSYVIPRLMAVRASAEEEHLMDDDQSMSSATISEHDDDEMTDEDDAEGGGMFGVSGGNTNKSSSVQQRSGIPMRSNLARLQHAQNQMRARDRLQEVSRRRASTLATLPATDIMHHHHHHHLQSVVAQPSSIVVTVDIRTQDNNNMSSRRQHILEVDRSTTTLLDLKLMALAKDAIGQCHIGMSDVDDGTTTTSQSRYIAYTPGTGCRWLDYDVCYEELGKSAVTMVIVEDEGKHFSGRTTANVRQNAQGVDEVTMMSLTSQEERETLLNAPAYAHQVSFFVTSRRPPTLGNDDEDDENGAAAEDATSSVHPLSLPPQLPVANRGATKSMPEPQVLFAMLAEHRLFHNSSFVHWAPLSLLAPLVGGSVVDQHTAYWFLRSAFPSRKRFDGWKELHLWPSGFQRVVFYIQSIVYKHDASGAMLPLPNEVALEIAEYL